MLKHLNTVLIIFSIICSPVFSHEINPDTNYSNIENRALQSIDRLLSGTQEQHHYAHHIHNSISYGALAGIFAVNGTAVEMRGMWIGKRWQTLMQDRIAICWQQPDELGLKPIILINTQANVSNEKFDQALIKAYLECEFRELNVIVKKKISDPFIPCTNNDSKVTIYSAAKDILISPPCHADEHGICHFALPPAVYMFKVSCLNDPTSPEYIFREVKKGNGIQVEGFNNLFWLPQNWEQFKQNS